MYAARWSSVQTSMPVCEVAAAINGMTIATFHFRGRTMERFGDCVPALSWMRRGLAKSPLVNMWLARATLASEMGYLLLCTRWISTHVNPSDEPSRGGLPDKRTLAWRPTPLTHDQIMHVPEWPLGLSTFQDIPAGVERLRAALPEWYPPATTGYHDTCGKWT